MTHDEQSCALHAAHKGKIATALKVTVETKEDLSLVYTPGVGAVARAIADDSTRARIYTNINNTVAIVSDGSAVLGLGNIGPLAAMPVMEGKAVLFKKFADIDAVPIVLSTQDPIEIIAAVKAIAPSFGGINLEDIAAPHCFVVEEALQRELSIPVFHDDQHGTAIVVLAGLLNALKVRGLQKEDTHIVINGAGAAGLAIYELLGEAGFPHIVVVDSKGVLTTDRADLNTYKKSVAERTSPSVHTLAEALTQAHVFIGVSVAGGLPKELVHAMQERPIIFAMANPVPEILPDEAYQAGAFIVATGRSDFANQINNALAFPGLFRGALDTQTVHITPQHMYKAALAIAGLIENPTVDHIIPDIFDTRLAPAVAAVFTSAV